VRRAVEGEERKEEHAILLEILDAVRASLYYNPIRFTTGRHPDIRVWLWAIKTRMPTSVDQPNPAIVARAGTYCRNETARRAPRVWGRRKKVSSNRSSVVWLLFKSPSPSCAARRGNRVPASRFKSSAHLVCAHCPFVPVLANAVSTRCRRNLVPLSPVRQNSPRPPVSRLSVPVFLHLHLSS